MFFQWDRKTLIQNNEFVTLNMEGNSYNDSIMNISRDGSIKFSVNYTTLYYKNHIKYDVTFVCILVDGFLFS